MGMGLTVFVEPGAENRAVSEMFKEEGYIVTNDIHKADFICLIGGSDVDPSLYDSLNTSSYTNMDHDLTSLGLFYYSNKLEIPMVGICRGGQFISSVILRFPLVQNIDNHQMTNHTLDIPPYSEYCEYDGIEVTSDHHQCMSGELLTLNVGNGNGEVFKSPDGIPEVLIDRGEVNLTPSFCLCYQPHPEWVDHHHPCRRLFFAIIENEYKKIKENV